MKHTGDLCNPKTFTYTCYGHSYNAYLLVSTYRETGNMALVMLCDDSGYTETIGTFTVNFNNLEPCFAYLNTNGYPNISEIVEKLGFASNTGTIMRSGYCEYPLYKFDIEAMRDYLSVSSDYYLV